MRLILGLLLPFFLGQQLPIGGIPVPSGGGGGGTFTVLQHPGNSGGALISIVTTATTAGQSIIVCTGDVGISIPATISDNATGGTNVYTERTSAQGSTSAGGFRTQCFDALNTPRGGVTQIEVTAATSAYVFAAAWVVTSSGGTVSYDNAGGTTNAVGSGGTDAGPSVVASGSGGFMAAAILVNNGVITANPASGNPFTSGGYLDNNAGASYAYSSAGTYQPVWTNSTSGDQYSASVVAYK